MFLQSKVRIVSQDSMRDNPACRHGPTVLFEREKQRPYFACSAFRDRKDCPFFLWKDEQKAAKRKNPKTSNRNQVLDVKDCPKKKHFCKTCSQLIDDTELQNSHKSHNVHKEMTAEERTRPSEFLDPLEGPKKQAQFHFTQESTNMLIKNLAESENFSHIICIGVPSVFEEVKSSVRAILLDIDDRHRQFHGKSEFCHYNMFNHHFFDQTSENNYKSFLDENGRSYAIITDPPFGGRVELIARTLKIIASEVNSSSKEVHLFWIFPYFMESQIQHELPEMKMSDYQITYKKSSGYKQGHAGHRNQGSPVRLFTTLPLSRLVLPEVEGYRKCQTCKCFVAVTNRHCHFCGKCTAKNGGLYRHCQECQRCVKLSWSHCGDCNRCALPEHPCDLFKSKSKTRKG